MDVEEPGPPRTAIGLSGAGNGLLIEFGSAYSVAPKDRRSANRAAWG